MSAMTIEIDRLTIALHGVSAEVAEAAVQGLDAALRRRLGSVRGGRSLTVPSLGLGVLDLPSGADAAALRELIAARLCDAIDHAHAPQQGEAG